MVMIMNSDRWWPAYFTVFTSNFSFLQQISSSKTKLVLGNSNMSFPNERITSLINDIYNFRLQVGKKVIRKYGMDWEMFQWGFYKHWLNLQKENIRIFTAFSARPMDILLRHWCDPKFWIKLLVHWYNVKHQDN